VNNIHDKVIDKLRAAADMLSSGEAFVSESCAERESPYHRKLVANVRSGVGCIRLSWYEYVEGENVEPT